MGNAAKYSLYMRVMHWFVGVLILGMLASGVYMTDLSWDLPIKSELYSLHKSFGMIVIPLVFLRLFIRLASKVPQLPDGISSLDKFLSKLGVVILYWLMFVIPISGYLMSVTSGRVVEVFGLQIPSLLDKDTDLSSFFHSIHTQVWYFFLALVAIHILYSVKHIIFNKVNLLNRIV